jgi:hypothetical protein
VTTSEGEIVYCTSSEYHSGSQLVNVIIDGLPYQFGWLLCDRTQLQLEDASSSTSTRHPSREVFMANRDRTEGYRNCETLSQISEDSKIIENKGAQARDAR